MGGHFGFQQGDYFAVGSALKEPFECDFSEAFYTVVEDGKAIYLFGYLSDDSVNNNLGIKTKDDNDKWVDFTGKFLRIELPIEVIEKEYNGKKSKKEPTPQSAYIAKQLKEQFKESEPFKLFINLGASAAYVESLETGKTSKGKEIPEDTLEDFKAELFKAESIESLEHLKDKNQGAAKGGYSKRVSQVQIIAEKIEGVHKLIQSDETALQLTEIIQWVAAQDDTTKAAAIHLVAGLLS